MIRQNYGVHDIDVEKLKGYSFELGPIRPPSEGGSYSLLLRATRNCSWNRCNFCRGLSFGKQKLQLRTVEEVKRDIDTIEAISSEIKAISWQLGYGGRINGNVGAAIIQASPDLDTNQSFVVVFNWLYFGAKTVFIQDADSLIMRTGDLIEIVKYLKQTFPTIDRVTSYARMKTVFRKSLEELKELNKAGLSRLHCGMESGDDELLLYIDKGVTSEEQIEAGRKAKEAGYELSLYIMPDLGGRERSEQHARNTARVLNMINPDFVRMRPFVPRKGTPMYEEYQRGELRLSSPHERLREIKTLIELLDFTGSVCFDHMLNSWYREDHRLLFKQDYDGYKFPEEKKLLLELIELGLQTDESIHVHAKEFVNLPHL